MFKVKNRTYFINEKEVVRVIKINDLYFALLNGGEKVEIEEEDYYNLGGR